MMSRPRFGAVRLAVALLAIGFVLAACEGGSGQPLIDPGDGGNYRTSLDPADFVTRVDNPYFPLAPGSRWEYQAVGDGEMQTIEVVVTDQTRDILGIRATVVRDTVRVDGEVIEDTFDWYAQDTAGNVWYLGEDTKEYENGQVVSTEGTWEAGVDGAQAGIVMKADPQVGNAYRQEFYRGQAEDIAQVVRLGDSQTVPAGSYQGLLVTHEWTPLLADVVEEKYYAQGVGAVLESTVQGGSERIELIAYQAGA
ncbi:MAG: hypothetical protein JW785_07525 [Acidimicrobiia bacterium]|nr:hypothetical protein [Acidimicrobiia bacterium]